MDNDKGASGANKGASGVDDKDPNIDPNAGGGGNDDKGVSHDTYRKTVTEAKNAKAHAKELEAKLAEIENGKLAAEGKKDELIAKLQKQVNDSSKSNKETLNAFLSQSLDAQVRVAAAKMGCVDAEAVCKLLDMSEFEVDTKTFKADEKQIDEALAGLKKSKAYLFNKAAPRVDARMPNGKIPRGEKTIGGKTVKEMTQGELLANLKTARK